MTQALKFGMYTECEGVEGVSHASVFGDVLELVEHLDARGYDVFCTLEHPFFERFAINVNPLALYAAMAQRTRRIRFRTLCHTLPLHNPMVLAGEIAQVDILTGGRLDCGVGRGHAWLQEPANVRMEENQGRFDESIDILVNAWTQPRFSYRGQYYTCDQLSVVPRPLQQPHPPIFVVGSSGRQFRRAARSGWGICVGGPVPSQAFYDGVNAYRAACAEFGTRPYVGFVKAIWLDEDGERAVRDARRPCLDFIRYNFSPALTTPRTTAAEQQRLRDSGFAWYIDPPFLPLLDWSYEQLLERGVIYVGTPVEVGRQLRELYREAGGFDELIIMSHYGGCSRAQALQTQELFARDVMPMLRAG
jgi:alkanesulfonate monooxygenase SsuD/methylene tetrahydromethanopterin reductase-like flavin-dependent oxidoreductase (luciferase family)